MFRWTYSEFAKRYRVLLPERNLEPKQFAKNVCTKFLSTEAFAFGKTKIFMKVGEIAKMESLRQQILHNSAVKIQTCYRGFIARRFYKQLLQQHKAAGLLTSFFDKINRKTLKTINLFNRT